MPRVTTRVVPRGISTVSSPSGQPPDDRSTVVNGGQWRRSTTVNGGEPPLTTAGPPVNHRSTVVDLQSTDGSRPGQETDIHKRTKNKAKNDKTGHGMEKCDKTKPNQSQIVNQAKNSTEKSNSRSQSQLREAEAENTT
ncbi:hypothetical protein Tco_1470885 [Tanacetum coccineum]